MKIIEPQVIILTELDGPAILKHIERCARVCYKSEAKITEDSAYSFLAGIISRGHESVLEHFSFSVRFICDRGVSHEIVRHRIASFSQESTRYCNYGNCDDGITVIRPPLTEAQMPLWLEAMESSEKTYLAMLAAGASPQMARSVLPNSLKTELIMSANLREWRHFLKLRTESAAHPQIREVAIDLARQLKAKIPVIFDDIQL